MRILHVLLSINQTSAPYNEHILASTAKHSITVCTYFAPQIQPNANIKLFSGDNSLPGFFRQLKQAIYDDRYDAIHAHSPHVGFLFIFTSLFLNPTLLRSTVYTIHGSYPNYKLRNRLMLVWIFLFFRRIICCSSASYASFPPYFKWLAGYRLQVIPNGVDIERIDRVINVSNISSNPNDFTITSIGRLIELKRPNNVLEAFLRSDIPNGRLIFIGEGHLRSSIISSCKKKGVSERVKVTGVISRELVYQYLSSTDLYISTSIIEGLPISVLEAMACRCPVVLSDIPAHQEIAGVKEFIPLVSPDDIEEFSHQINKFHSMSTEERIAIGEKCRKLVKDKFSLQFMSQGYEIIYRQIMEYNAEFIG